MKNGRRNLMIWTLLPVLSFGTLAATTALQRLRQLIDATALRFSKIGNWLSTSGNMYGRTQ